MSFEIVLTLSDLCFFCRTSSKFLNKDVKMKTGEMSLPKPLLKFITCVFPTYHRYILFELNYTVFSKYLKDYLTTNLGNRPEVFCEKGALKILQKKNFAPNARSIFVNNRFYVMYVSNLFISYRYFSENNLKNFETGCFSEKPLRIVS